MHEWGAAVGQLTTVMEGSMAKELYTPLGPYHTTKPGVDSDSTIVQHYFRYRAPARKGLWKVEVVSGIGYVCHHVEVNGPDLLRRAALVGVSLGNDHADRNIVYVNRYDWARLGAPTAGYELMTELKKPEKKTPANPKPLKVKSFALCPEGLDEDEHYSSEDEDEEDESESESDDVWSRAMNFDTDEVEEFDRSEDERLEYTEALTMNRFMLVDEHRFPQLVQSLRDGVKLDSKNYLFKVNRKATAESAPATQLPQETSFSDAFGAYLGIEEDENECGWLAFQNGELVGFVHDGVCCYLEGRHFRCGDTEVEVPREPTPDEDEFWDREEREVNEDDESCEDSEDGCNSPGKRLRR